MSEVMVVNDKTFEIVKSATNKLVDMVRLTYGPASNKVVIDKFPYKMVVDDGVQIARDFQLEDPAEQAIVRIIKEVAIKTNDRVGDGTTGALILIKALVNTIAGKTRWDGHMIERELKVALEEVKAQLDAMAVKIETKEDLKKVAMISFDNEKIADMISELYVKLGKDGIITVEKSSTLETTMEITDGVKIENGYISPYMITNPERMEAVIDKPHILITDYRITEVNDILPIMDKMVKDNKRELVVICENMENHALATAVVNKIQGKFLLVSVVAPKGDDRKVFLEDLAMMTGAKMFTVSKGDKLENATIADLGRAERFISRSDETVIVKPLGDAATIATAITQLRTAVEAEQEEDKKKALERRLATFTGSIAVIKVGAATENEQKALKYKVDDAVNAVKEAYRHGVVPGAGRALSMVTTSSKILNDALKKPEAQLFENMGMDHESAEFEGMDAYNVVTGEKGNFMEVGVMDPVGVLKAGVESAVSITSLLVTCKGMLVEHAVEEKK